MGNRADDERLKELRDKGIEIYSISKLDNINNCLYAAYRTYKLHERGKDNAYNLTGTRLHDVLEGIANEKNTEDDLIVAMKDELDNLDLLGISFPKDRNGGDSIRQGWIDDITHFCNTFKFPKGDWETEQLFIYQTDEGKYLQGYIDLIKNHSDGTISIIDHKSSSMYDKSGIEDHSKQLLVYLLGKQQEGFKVNKIAWHFMKYVDISFMGKKTSKSKELSKIKKTVERRKIGSEMAKYVEQDLYNLGIDELESDILLDEFRKTNIFPDVVKDKYIIKPCIIEYEITDEALENCKKYIRETIEKWENLGTDESNYPPREFTKIQKNGKEVQDTFFCQMLCGYSNSCPYLHDYLDTLQKSSEESDEDLF